MQAVYEARLSQRASGAFQKEGHDNRQSCPQARKQNLLEYYI